MNDAEIAAGLPPTPGYRYAEQVGDQLFVAGQVPQDASGAIIAPGEARRQAAVCLDNLSTILAVHGFETADVRRLVVYVVGEQDDVTTAWSGVLDWFDGSVPPATLLGINRLGFPGQVVEIDATVVRSRRPS